MSSPHFLLVGNGPYLNRGCEGIVRGTMEILRREFGLGTTATVVTLASRDVVAQQAGAEIDSGIFHVALDPVGGRWSRDWIHVQLMKLLHSRTEAIYRPRDLPVGLRNWPYRAMEKIIRSAKAVLEIGGDNYSLDYGWPEKFLGIDRYAQRHRRPLVIWGASVGPFDTAPAFAQERIFRHLASLHAVFVRESSSLDYLQSRGVSNVFLVCDPAFTMKPKEPDLERVGFPLPKNAIGVNLSSLMASYVTGGDRARWVRLCSDTVMRIVKGTGCQVLLIPHVTFQDERESDADFLRAVMQGMALDRAYVQCVPDVFSAAEIKWIIARCAIFMGARTHSTIAALSSCVPTLSLAYSNKAYGINQDLFKTQEYCLNPGELSDPDKVGARLEKILAEFDSIRNRLCAIMPKIIQRAYMAGPLLRHVLSGDERKKERVIL